MSRFVVNTAISCTTTRVQLSRALTRVAGIDTVLVVAVPVVALANAMSWKSHGVREWNYGGAVIAPTVGQVIGDLVLAPAALVVKRDDLGGETSDKDDEGHGQDGAPNGKLLSDAHVWNVAINRAATSAAAGTPSR